MHTSRFPFCFRGTQRLLHSAFGSFQWKTQRLPFPPFPGALSEGRPTVIHLGSPLDSRIRYPLDVFYSCLQSPAVIRYSL